jgi:WD40 repeat protein/energy-coupling factor transporter ATP-binding protein EcfA2
MDYFPSLRAFQNAHRGLLQRYRVAEKVTPELQSELEQLLRLGSETGRILDTLSDQKAAQGLLDYWSTILSREKSDGAGPLLKDFDPNTEPELADENCPYVGLQSVKEDQSSLFLGREDLVRDMLDRLRDGNLVAVTGPLGSGRSSLVYAGLLPALTHGQLLGSESWPVKRLTPPLTDHLAAIGHDPTSVTIVDNCDDLFAFGSEREQATFASDVLALVDKPGVRRIVVLILHSDYEQLLIRQPELAARIKSANVQVTSPTAKDLRDAIERPAQLVGLKFDDYVVDSIVHDIVGERAAFTLLQFTMKRLWARRTHNRITFKTLQEVGAGRKAVVRAAQAFYQGLPPDRQQLLHPILVRLGSVPDTVASTWRTLVDASADPSEADRLLKELLQADLITVSTREVGGSPVGERVVRLVHDALKDWDILSEWIKKEEDQLEYFRRLEEKAHEWARSGRSKYSLLSELEFLQAKERLSSPDGSRSGASDDVRKFMEASRRRHRSEVRNLRVVLTGFVIGNIIIAVLGVIAWDQWGEAARHRDLAVLQGELRRTGVFDLQISALQKQLSSGEIRVRQLRQSAVEAQRENLVRAQDLDNQIKRVEAERATIRGNIEVLADDRNNAIAKIAANNVTRWNREVDGRRREQIIDKALQTVASDKLSPHSRFLIAMWAVAAIPQTDARLNAALRKAILGYPLRSQFSPPWSQQVWAVAFNPVNVHQAAVGDERGRVWLWDPLGDSSPDRFSVAGGGVANGLAYSADGGLLAAAYRTAGVVVWDVGTGEEKCRLGGGKAAGNTYSVAFAPDGKTLAVAAGQSVQLWDLSKQGCPALPQVFRQNDEVFSVAFSSVDNLLATASGDGVVAVWKRDSPAEPFLTLTKPSGNPMLAVSFSPTGKLLVASSGANGRGYVWDVETSQQIVELPTQGGTIGQIAFSPDATLLVATASANGTAFVSNVRTGMRLHELGGGGRNPMFGATFSPDSKYLLTGNLDGVARLWDVGNDEIAANDREALIALGAQKITDIKLTPDECGKLRDMNIPVFALADRGYENEQGFICPLPFLEPRPAGARQVRMGKAPTIGQEDVAQSP